MMKRIGLCAIAVLCAIACSAAKYRYRFVDANLADALASIAEQHPEIRINFIYNDIEHYTSTTSIDTDDAYRALRQVIGLNPVSITNKGNGYYIEALQHGKFIYYGKAAGDDKEPVVGASVLLLTPGDSTVITYGVTDSNGQFSIPCDRKKVLAKFSCVGYKTTYVVLPQFAMGTVTMPQATIQLSAVSVEADNTVLSTDRNVYIPSSSQKKASQDAADLLRRMAIPQLVINPGDNSVKDVFGNSVPVFINYHEAQADELKGMKMTDVRRIEFIEFPADPRFKGEQRVVNFIVQEYEYGGYTKVSEAFRTLNGVFSNSDFFSRFSYKKMTYDVSAGSYNKSYHHAGSDILAVYGIENGEGPLSVNRKEVFGESATRSGEVPVSVRATYSTPRFTARNALSFTHFSAPEQRSAGDLSVSLQPTTDYTFSRSTPNRNNTIYYYSNLQGLIGANGSFDITPGFRHTHRNNLSLYHSTLMQEPINNQITENATNWWLQATGRVVLARKNQLSLFLAGGQNFNKLIYRGTNNINDSYYNSFFVGLMRYRYQANKFSFNSFLGFGYVHNSMNGVTTSDAHPRVGANAVISLNQRSQISAELSYKTTTPDIDMKANDIVRSNEYMYLTANPDLKNWRNMSTNISYNRYCGNSFSFAAFAGYDRDFNRVATVYRPYDNGKALLRDFINDGSFIRYYLGASANCKLFSNSLQLYANLTQNAYEITGSYKESYFPFRVQLQAVYYWKAFNILASWVNPQRTLTENSNYIIRGRNFHTVSVGWGNGIWTVDLAAINIFNKGWRSETWEKHTPLYAEKQQFYDPSAHPALKLSVSYTVGYGRTIRRGNEAAAATAAPSAIIK